PGSTLRRCAPPPDGLRNALRAKNATAAAAGGVRLIEDKKMDLIGGLKTEVFRPVIMLMVPGLVVGVPTLFVLQHYQPGLFDFIESHPTLSTFIGFIAATILGVLTYEFGTNIEAKIIDKCIEKKGEKDDIYATFIDDWYLFLRCTLPERSVAQEYISERVLYLKFELGMAAAAIPCLLFSFWAWKIRDDFSGGWFAVLVVTLIVVFLYFLYESYQSGKVLARLRKEILKGIGSPPKYGQA
ncbi:hypothetical protein, partial [Microbulbifer taiwanensis]